MHSLLSLLHHDKTHLEHSKGERALLNQTTRGHTWVSQPNVHSSQPNVNNHTETCAVRSTDVQVLDTFRL